MKKILTLALAAIMVLSLAACGGSSAPAATTAAPAAPAGETAAPAPEAPAAAEVKIAVVCDASGQNDNGYNQSAVEGAKELADQYGIAYKVVEPTESTGDTLAALAEDGYNLIFSMEYDFDALVSGEAGADPIAVQYPDTTFVVFNATPNVDAEGKTIHDNVISILYNVNESSYLAGALATLVNENADVLFGDGYSFTPTSQARAMGFIGGTNSDGITVFSYGFIEGVQHVAQELGVTYDYYAKYDAGFSDVAGGSTVAGTYYDNGANVVYAVAGSIGDGVAAKAKEEGKLAIHCDANKDGQQPGYILTSVIKNTRVVVKELTEALMNGELDKYDRITMFDLASGSTSITDLATISAAIAKTDEAQAKWTEIQDYVKDLSAKISDGTIKVTNMQNGDSFDQSTCPNINFK
ncbi:MAG: BMP family ABC transporter substrate-binding protein [Oscillospiraceae bacterium]|nr:BMP family ABC transporter substrate-binding protein [Oscillospiraceae bacterium]